MRMRASWFGSLRPTGYKVAARVPRPTANSPRICHPDHNQRATVLGSIKARPGDDGVRGAARATAGLDSPCARRPPTRVGRGEETGFKVEQRNWNEESGECRKTRLTSKAPYKDKPSGRPTSGAVLDGRCARRPHHRAGRDGRMAPPGAEQKNGIKQESKMPSDQIP